MVLRKTLASFLILLGMAFGGCGMSREMSRPNYPALNIKEATEAAKTALEKRDYYDYKTVYERTDCAKINARKFDIIGYASRGWSQKTWISVEIKSIPNGHKYNVSSLKMNYDYYGEWEGIHWLRILSDKNEEWDILQGIENEYSLKNLTDREKFELIFGK